MPRLARIKGDGEVFYHLCNKIAGKKNEFPLSEDKKASRKFVDFIHFYGEAYQCEIVSFVVMGNHYHLIVQFEEFQELTEKQLYKIAQKFYPNTHEFTKEWDEAQWERFNNRIYDVSEFMRNVQMGFSKWYNKTYQRKGRLWAERFKSVILTDEKSILNCMQYIELNPVRAGIIKSNRPEDYEYSSLYMRDIKLDYWLKDLTVLMEESDHKSALQKYKAMVYYRGGVRSKEGQKEIPESVIEQVERENFESKRVFMKKLRFYSDGLIIGTEELISEWLGKLRDKVVFKRRINLIT